MEGIAQPHGVYHVKMWVYDKGYKDDRRPSMACRSFNFELCPLSAMGEMFLEVWPSVPELEAIMKDNSQLMKIMLFPSMPSMVHCKHTDRATKQTCFEMPA